MREIKFKIWLPYSKVMMQPKDIITIWESILNGVTIGQMKQWVHLQYTGLIDKNGKEIYEGDIVKSEAFHGSIEATMYETEMKKQGKLVDWMKLDVILGHPHGHYIMRPLNDMEDMTYTGNALPGKSTFETDFEVIGNIYENPELLKHSVGMRN